MIINIIILILIFIIIYYKDIYFNNNIIEKKLYKFFIKYLAKFENLIQSFFNIILIFNDFKII